METLCNGLIGIEHDTLATIASDAMNVIYHIENCLVPKEANELKDDGNPILFMNAICSQVDEDVETKWRVNRTSESERF